MKKLPAPRLQLRWEQNHGDANFNWLCHYELVIPLGEYDIRREPDDKTELIVALTEPTRRDAQVTPCTTPGTSEQYCDAPFRDGAHAQWDSKALGGLPIYVIAPNGKAFLKEVQP